MDLTMSQFLDDSLFGKDHESSLFPGLSEISPSSPMNCMFNQSPQQDDVSGFLEGASSAVVDPYNLSSHGNSMLYNDVSNNGLTLGPQETAVDDDFKAQQIALMISELLQQNNKLEDPIAPQQQLSPPLDANLPLLVPKQEHQVQSQFPYIENIYPAPSINTNNIQSPHNIVSPNSSVPSSVERLSNLRPKLVPLQPAINGANSEKSFFQKNSRNSLSKNKIKVASSPAFGDGSLKMDHNVINSFDFHMSDMSTTESKKFKNMISARKFRMRKKEYVSDLESRFKTVCAEKDALERENIDLKSLVADLKKQIDSLSLSSSSLSETSGSVSSTSSQSNLTSNSVASSPIVKFNPKKDVGSDSISKNKWNSRNGYIVVNSCFLNPPVANADFLDDGSLKGVHDQTDIDNILDSTFGKPQLPSRDTVIDLIRIALVLSLQYQDFHHGSCIAPTNDVYLWPNALQTV
ncbi:hypothetical protein AYI68_g4372 [Smittium mucronatum]|uniref:BZIP domain-containing protein n=1 Tax=Smittium mucronatum TaxID=133383 RepID=A0A1R0GX99_9FUNG|nr:hypothetical protein AYI68_g4372 [Smittium mucronatum]